MTEIEKLARQIDDTIVREGFTVLHSEVPLIAARAALQHLGERRGIDLSKLHDDDLPRLREYIRHWGCLWFVADEVDAELARRAAANDEWREAIRGAFLNERGSWDGDEAACNRILAAIAPLRERLGRFDEMVKIADEHRHRAEAAEAELERLRDVIRSWAKGAHGCAADSTTQ